MYFPITPSPWVSTYQYAGGSDTVAVLSPPTDELPVKNGRPLHASSVSFRTLTLGPVARDCLAHAYLVSK